MSVDTDTTATETTEKAFESNPKPIHESLASYVSTNSGVSVTAAQAEALLKFHGKWQSSPERKAEREQEKAAAAEEAAKRKEENEAKKAAAKAKREAEAAEKKAKKAAEKGDDSDLDDSLDDLDGETETPAPKPARSRRKPAAATDDDL